MLVKIMKNKFLSLLACTVPGALCLYNGAACLATLYKAGHQPYLLAGTERLHFMGYHMMAALHGLLCIVLAVTLLLLIRLRKKAGKG